LKARAEAVRQHATFSKNAAEALQRRSKSLKDKAQTVTVEARLYESFVTPADGLLSQKFHNVEWGRRFDIVQQFSDDRLIHFGHRLLFYKDPELLPLTQRSAMRKFFVDRLLLPQEARDWMTIAQAKAVSLQLSQNLQGDTAVEASMRQRQLAVLNDFNGYVNELENTLRSFERQS